MTLQSAVDTAVAQNVDYQSALLAVDRARNSLSDLVNWKAISVSATQKQSSDAKVAPTSTLGLNLPLFDQLGASASLDQVGNAQVAVTANPLAHSDTATQARIAYEKAILAATQARSNLETSVRKAWLAQASAQAQVDVQARSTALKETAYQDSRARYEKGTVTLAEVRTALKAWTDARSAQTTLERTLVKAKATLAGLLQSAATDVAVLTVAELEALVSELGPVDTTVVGASSAVKAQALEVEAQKAKAEAVWWLDPDLSIAANASVPVAGQVTWSGSLTLSLSLGSWQGSDRSLADRSVALAVRTLEAQATAARSSELQALLSWEAALSAVESRALALTSARELLQEAQWLADAGEATSLEVDEALLGVTSAENDVFQAWADAYGARLDLEAARR